MRFAFVLSFRHCVLFAFFLLFLISIKGSKPTIVLMGFSLKGGGALEFGMETFACSLVGFHTISWEPPHEDCGSSWPPLTSLLPRPLTVPSCGERPFLPGLGGVWGPLGPGKGPSLRTAAPRAGLSLPRARWVERCPGDWRHSPHHRADCLLNLVTAHVCTCLLCPVRGPSSWTETELASEALLPGPRQGRAG